MFKRLFLCLIIILCALFPVFSMRTACLNSSIADLWKLAGGSVDITVAEAQERGFADDSVILVDSSSGRNINLEVLISAEPDLVLGSVDTESHVRLKAFLCDISVDMLLIKQDSFDDFLSIFKTLTGITGRNDLYQKYGEGQRAGIEELIEEAKEAEKKPRVLFIRAGSWLFQLPGGMTPCREEAGENSTRKRLCGGSYAPLPGAGTELKPSASGAQAGRERPLRAKTKTRRHTARVCPRICRLTC